MENQILINQISQNIKKELKKSKNVKKKIDLIREGDWICNICNNLNFSFRLQCNRCQSNQKKKVKSFRKPLKDLTNIEENSINFEGIQKNGFKNFILITPPKKYIPKEHFEEILAYKSPEFDLPSISPIMREIFLENQRNFVHNEQYFVRKNQEKTQKNDWICGRCRNLNYSFRIFCNRCQILK